MLMQKHFSVQKLWCCKSSHQLFVLRAISAKNTMAGESCI